MDISTILSQIDLGSYAMPVFQRGYVWNRDQVRKLMNSLYRGYPIGELLVWNTETDPKLARGNEDLTPGNVNLILDGQQRMTSLYGVIRGKPPKFFDGNASAFTNLYFNAEDEVFAFYLATKMKNDPAWVDVTELMQVGASEFIQQRMQNDQANVPFWIAHMAALNRLDAIKKLDIHIQTVSGPDKTIDVVVEIFNNVNSGGTKLSKGDLALARICGAWPGAREAFKAVLAKYCDAGYDFSMDWLLRCITVQLTGQPYYNALGAIAVDKIQTSLKVTDALIGTCLDHIGNRLGLDHARVLGSVFAIVTMIGYLRYRGGKLTDGKEWDQLLYWYVHAFLWGRYASSTESNLAQDLNAINNGDGIDGLIRLLKQLRGDLTIRPEDFWSWSTGARFYPLLYLLARTNHSRDWGSNIELSKYLLGKNSSLEVHHIFPKDLLYKAGKNKAIVNSLANYAFLTKETNLDLSNTPPEKYFPCIIGKSPGAAETHWIPMDSDLWKLDNYEQFLTQRRILLANAANQLLDSLYKGEIAETPIIPLIDRKRDTAEAGEDEIDEMSAWMATHGLNEGTPNLELCDDCGESEAIIDLAWPQGIQSGLSEPIALLLNETADTQAIVSKHGYRYYTSAAELKKYIETTYLS